MLMKRNTHRGRLATFQRGVVRWLAVVILLPAVLGGMSSRAAAQDFPLPDTLEVIDAYLRAREWVTAFRVPSIGQPEALAPLGGAHGVVVQLRSSGRLVATGKAVLGVDGDAEELLRLAVRRALEVMSGDPAINALPEELQANVGAQVTLDLEVAGQPTPLPGGTFEDVAMRLEPGLDGVALRRGNRWNYLFPLEIRTENSARNLYLRLRTLPAELGLPDGDLPALREAANAQMYSFRAIHLTQTKPSDFPTTTFRGDHLVMDSDVTAARMVRFADDLAYHMQQRIWPPMPDDFDGDGPAPGVAPGVADLRRYGMRGTFRPAFATYESAVAPPNEQALAAFALALHGRNTHGSPELAAESRLMALWLMRCLAEPPEGVRPPLEDLSACAGIVYAASALRGENLPESVQNLVNAASNTVWRAFDVDAQSFEARDPATGELRSINPQDRGLLAGAMARLSVHQPERFSPEISRQALHIAWQGTPGPSQVALLPWAGWGEMDLWSIDPALGDAERLVMLRELMLALQAGPAMEGQLPDVRGGLLLMQGGRNHVTAQGLRAAAFLSAISTHPDHTPDGAFAGQFERVCLFGRFMLQLSIRQELASHLPSPDLSFGGIRNATWDNRQTVPAQALGLIIALDVVAGFGRSGILAN